ncbi:metallophosphoesterase family protein [Xanthobacter sp. DSM 24535]|uniref:metallophosphoesterase family protein n=1 Tax=Roseixanthobacter psychrophilus TaxID=3119917 RepID=UPI0037271FEE
MSNFTYAIADLHGRFDLLQSALERIENDSQCGTVVFLGDYVDRGPQSRQIIERLMAGPSNGWRWVCLKGNHEVMMVDALQEKSTGEAWIANGGVATLESYSSEGHPLGNNTASGAHIKWLECLPMIYADGDRIFVHAGVDPTRSIADQTEATLLWRRWGRDEDYEHPAGHVVHGHTPFPKGPILLGGRTNLDTGAVKTGRLVVGVFDNAVPGGPVRFLEIISEPAHKSREG